MKTKYGELARQAIEQVRERWAAVETELEEAHDDNDMARVQRLEEEREKLQEYVLAGHRRPEAKDLGRLRSRIENRSGHKS